MNRLRRGCVGERRVLGEGILQGYVETRETMAGVLARRVLGCQERSLLRGSSCGGGAVLASDHTRAFAFRALIRRRGRKGGDSLTERPFSSSRVWTSKTFAQGKPLPQGGIRALGWGSLRPLVGSWGKESSLGFGRLACIVSASRDMGLTTNSQRQEATPLKLPNGELFDRSKFTETLQLKAVKVPNRDCQTAMKRLAGHTLNRPRL